MSSVRPVITSKDNYTNFVYINFHWLNDLTPLKNITITLDEKTAHWVRIYAARQGKSVSRLLGEMLQERLREVRDYNQAMRRQLSRKPFEFDWVEGHKPARDELYDRANLR